MDVHLVRIDVYPDVLSVQDIDRIASAFSKALRDPDFNAWSQLYEGYKVVISKPHARRTVSQFWILASHRRGLNVASVLRKALPNANTADMMKPDLKPQHLCTWKVDMGRYRALYGREDNGDDLDYLFYMHFDMRPTDEQVTFYFPFDITDEQKDSFLQVVDASFMGERADRDDSSDPGCEGGTGFTLRTGPHGSNGAEPDFDNVAERWGLWSQNTQRCLVPNLKMGQSGQPVSRSVIIYSLWICWVNDEVRFRFTHQGLRCKDSALLCDMLIPDGADFWYAMENFAGCHGRDSRRLFWNREYELEKDWE